MNNSIEIIHDTGKLFSFLGNDPKILQKYIKEHARLVGKEYPDYSIDVHFGEIDCNTTIRMDGKIYNSNNINRLKDQNFIPENILFLEDQIDLENLR